ncbi:NAD(P)/FAD-dependent oxidoreductase [Streptomyces indicus]|uniref:NADH dehydrogenase, FAD-containing subunit n=1 Tax=Streptomyces indicus TaxID=417292 RepID=A0A1G9BYE6_9ACTN|nr:FAD-dependent oxidoreductase [Streptomyces indicus]SDK44184.1 NADH dehydrogenase, FAD-containing subunit [Streptomyces indicus]
MNTESAPATPHRIVVLGAGYTGMMTATRLARRTRRGPAVRITLVNPSPRFTERLRMHQIAAGQELADHRITELLDGTGVAFVEGWATAIDVEAREVQVSGSAEPLPYDTLVYALGSSTDTSRVPGVAEHAYTLNDPRTARRMSQELARLAVRGGAVTVSGGGLTGVEAAAEIAEAHPGLDVTLLSHEVPGSMMGTKAQAYLLRALDRLGVTVRAGVRVAKVLPDAVELADGELLVSDVSLWTAGVRVPALAADAGIAVDEAGRIRTDGTLRSVSHPEIHAIGDAARIEQAWGTVHGTCQSGIPSAAYTADAIARRLRGRKVKPFRFGYVHQPVSLGRKDAVIQFTRPDDTPRRIRLTGRSAVFYKETVSGSPVKTYRLTRKLAGALVWPQGGRATKA